MVPPFARFKLTPARRDAIIVAGCAAAFGAYLLAAGRGGHAGVFPLDDAWIFQTYARNLAQAGRWAFVPGVASSGATSILWVVLIVPAYVLRLNPAVWTLALGFGALIATALGGARLVDDERPGVQLVAGLAVGLAWQVVWAAASGMETALFCALAMWFWVWMRNDNPAATNFRARDGLLTGIFGGALMLVRPEGLLLAALAGLYVGTSALQGERRFLAGLRWGLLAALGLALILAPYVGFNYAISGHLWPNTLYAKQAEYAPLLALPLALRWAQQAGVALIGGQAVLLPALLVEAVQRARDVMRRDGGPFGFEAFATWALPVLWAALHWGLYAWTLPVTYQHGRYAIPTVPVLVVFGVGALARLARPHARKMLLRMGSLAWIGVAVALFPLMAFLLGAPSYAKDAAFIDEDIVATARWVAENTPPQTVIAAHDIGALGYLAPRPLVDLAGLVSPDVVPFIADPDRLAAYIAQRHADYLIVFPHWSPAYEQLVARGGFTRMWSADEQPGYVAYSDLGPLTVYAVRGSGP